MKVFFSTLEFPPGSEIASAFLHQEFQTRFNPGYPIIKRAIYNASEMIYSQKNVVFENSEYQNIRKVYSLWYLTRPDHDFQNTLTRFSVSTTDLIGFAPYQNSDFDLIEIFMIGIGSDRHPDYNGIIKLARTLLSTKLSVNRKVRILKDDFGIDLTKKVKEKMNENLGLGRALWEEAEASGIRKGEIRTWVSAVSAMAIDSGCCIDNAMNHLNVPKKLRPAVKKKIKKGVYRDEKNKSSISSAGI